MRRCIQGRNKLITTTLPSIPTLPRYTYSYNMFINNDHGSDRIPFLLWKLR